MAMNEEAIIEVSESHTAVIDGDTIVVKEAEMVPLPVQPPPMEPQPARLPIEPVSPLEDEERKMREADDKPKGWMGSQDAKDFAPFLVMEMKRIKPPSACIGRHNETERALGQSKKLNSFISKALQADWDGAIPIDAIDRMRQQLEQNIEALTRMLEAHQNMKKQRRQVRRRASNESVCPSCTAPLWEEGEDMVCLACGQEGLKKEAGTPHFEGLQYQISAFERAVVGTLINATVSGGRNLEELFEKLKKKYSLNEREQLAVQQILADMGYPVFKDRARVGEDEDPTDSDEPREWQTQYHA
jgi:hypothetical protein